MANQESKETLSVGKLDANTVAENFVLEYYRYFRDSPEQLHKFYKDESVLKWPGSESATTMDGIHEIIMASDYKACKVEVMNADAQESLMEGVILTVTGCLLGNDNMKRIISQTFFLAKQEKGFFVLNDNFRILDTQEILNHSFVHDIDKSASVTPHAPSAQESEPVVVPAEPEAVSKATTTKATDSGEETPEVIVPNSEAPKQPVTLTQNVTPPSVSDEKLEGQKISYASMLAKERQVGTSADNSGPKIIRVAPSSNQQSDAAPRANIAKGTKERSSYSHGSVENKSKILNTPSNNVRSEDSIARSVYIENLPLGITEDELAEAVKEFGQAKPSGIQIKSFPDGFCFGFVEFESETSAKSAVEARNIIVKGLKSRISFKKSGNRGGGPRARDFKGQERGEIRNSGSYRDDNRGRGYDRQNREFSQRNSQSGDGSRAYKVEAYPQNKWRNEERLPNGGPRRNGGQVQRSEEGRNNNSSNAADPAAKA